SLIDDLLARLRFLAGLTSGLGLDLGRVLLAHVNEVFDFGAILFRNLVDAFILGVLVTVPDLDATNSGLAVSHRAGYRDAQSVLLAVRREIIVHPVGRDDHPPPLPFGAIKEDLWRAFPKEERPDLDRFRLGTLKLRQGDILDGLLLSLS